MDATEAAVHFAKALTAAKIPHAVGGAIAYGFFGVARGTHHVDLNLFVDGEAAAGAIDVLINAGLSIERSSAINSALERGDARGSYSGMPVDLFFNSIPTQQRASRRIKNVTLHGVPIQVLSPEDTAIFKMLFFRGKDLVDVERLLGLMGQQLDCVYIRENLVELLGENDFRTKKWDEIIAQLVPRVCCP